jgi:putative membrane protein
MIGMHGMGAWMALWGVLGLAVVALIIGGAVWVARALSRRDSRPAVPPGGQPPGLEVAHAELRRRYAAGEISREDYLQGKVDLE